MWREEASDSQEECGHQSQECGERRYLTTKTDCGHQSQDCGERRNLIAKKSVAIRVKIVERGGIKIVERIGF